MGQEIVFSVSAHAGGLGGAASRRGLQLPARPVAATCRSPWNLIVANTVDNHAQRCYSVSAEGS